VSEYLTLAALELHDPRANRPSSPRHFMSGGVSGGVSGSAVAVCNTASGPFTSRPTTVGREEIALWAGLGLSAVATLIAVLLSLLGV
jgi:hypothetical protein